MYLYCMYIITEQIVIKAKATQIDDLSLQEFVFLDNFQKEGISLGIL